MRSSFLFLSSLAFLSLAACVRVDYIPLNDPPHAMMPRDPGQVQVFQTEKPTRPYTEVATIETQSGSTTPETIMEKMREEAGKRGCDGLIITGNNDATVTEGSFNRRGGSINTTQLRGYRGMCIVYTGPETAAPPAAAPPPPPAAPPPVVSQNGAR
jgi:hypothetical protein